jgi:hypothetical protein
MLPAKLAWSAGGVLGIALGLGLHALPPARSNLGGVSPSDTGVVLPPLSAGMLRRLAEAADGYRTGRTVWVVISRLRPFPVAGVFYDSLTAARIARDSGPASWVSTPVQTPPDFPGREQAFLLIKHCPPTYIPCMPNPDLLRLLPRTIAEMDSMTLTFYPHSGPPLHDSFRASDVDAVFFSVAALDKFVIRYYSDISGPDVAAELRRSIIGGIRFGP